jgi:hypothetical protein
MTKYPAITGTRLINAAVQEVNSSDTIQMCGHNFTSTYKRQKSNSTNTILDGRLSVGIFSFFFFFIWHLLGGDKCVEENSPAVLPCLNA